MKIYKDFLPKEEYFKLKEIICSDNFPWFWSDCVVSNNEEKKAYDFQFYHTFYGVNKVNSPYFDILKPLLKCIDYFSLLRIKVNLRPQTPRPMESHMHMDFLDVPKTTKVTTGILYLDSTNGYTIFNKGKKIKSKDNLYVEVDSSVAHKGTSCSDGQRRLLINLNYIKN